MHSAPRRFAARNASKVLRAMQRVRVLDREGKPIGVFTYNGQVANRALELIGKELGMLTCSAVVLPVLVPAT